jgi:hypothetical protein
MKKFQMVLLAVLLVSASSYSQKRQSQIGGGSDVTLPTGEFGNFYKTGFGGYVKALVGAGKNGQVTFTFGYTRHKEIGGTPEWNSIASIMPLLAGYRHYINNFFVEPQMGYGIYNIKYVEFDEFWTESGGAFTFAASAGMAFSNQIEISARYQTGGQHGKSIGVFGVRLGYNFNLKSSK